MIIQGASSTPHCTPLPTQDTLDSVEALIKKHEDFEKSLEAQEEKVNAVQHFAQKLMAAGHYDTVAIANRRDAVLQRCVPITVSGWSILH